MTLSLEGRNQNRFYGAFKLPCSDNPKESLVLKMDQNPKQCYSKSIIQDHQTLAEIKQNLEGKKLAKQTKSLKGCEDAVDKAWSHSSF